MNNCDQPWTYPLPPLGVALDISHHNVDYVNHFSKELVQTFFTHPERVHIARIRVVEAKEVQS
jgi:hypothetical protein